MGRLIVDRWNKETSTREVKMGIKLRGKWDKLLHWLNNNLKIYSTRSLGKKEKCHIIVKLLMGQMMVSYTETKNMIGREDFRGK